MNKNTESNLWGTHGGKTGDARIPSCFFGSERLRKHPPGEDQLARCLITESNAGEDSTQH